MNFSKLIIFSSNLLKQIEYKYYIGFKYLDKFKMKTSNEDSCFTMLFIFTYLLTFVLCSSNNTSDNKPQIESGIKNKFDLMPHIVENENSTRFNRKKYINIYTSTSTQRHSKQYEFPSNSLNKIPIKVLKIKPEQFMNRKRFKYSNKNSLDSNMAAYQDKRNLLNHFDEIHGRRDIYFLPYFRKISHRNRIGSHKRDHFYPYFFSNPLFDENRYINEKLPENQHIPGINVHYSVIEDLSFGKDANTLEGGSHQIAHAVISSVPLKIYPRAYQKINENELLLKQEKRFTSEPINTRTFNVSQKMDFTNNIDRTIKFTSQIPEYQFLPYRRNFARRSHGGHIKKQLSQQYDLNSFQKESKTQKFDFDRWKYDKHKETKAVNDQIQHSTLEEKQPDEATETNLEVNSTNKLYFEKFPSNLNNSWYLYVNCSREFCQFTNSSNQTELLNEGWVVHNCSTYGCTELHPKPDSTRRFIGLMLFVFSLCVFKIIGFLLVFYYCRRINLPQKKAEDMKILSWDDEDSPDLSGEDVNTGFNKVQKQSPDNKLQKRENSPVGFNFDAIENEKLQTGSAGFETNPVPVERFNSKIWVPPMKVSPCLVPSPEIDNKTIDPTSLQKAIQACPISINLPKPCKKKRSCIPQLVKKLNCREKERETVKEKKSQESIKYKKSQKKDEKELLLLDLNSEILNDNKSLT